MGENDLFEELFEVLVDSDVRLFTRIISDLCCCRCLLIGEKAGGNTRRENDDARRLLVAALVAILVHR
jgi:hypothetical protein